MTAHELYLQFNDFLTGVNEIVRHDLVLYFVLGVGLLFTLWSGLSQWRALTHGVSVIRGEYDNKGHPGAINHFQALSAALSATVGLGNIAGVALAVSLGGPGAIFWMWVVGFVGMAIKTTEVTLAMLYRDTSKPEEPHGGAMWVAEKASKQFIPAIPWIGKVFAVVFCLTLLISTFTGGNMFQAWNVGIATEKALGVPTVLTGVVIAIVTGLVIIGGIKRIGAVAGKLVPFMCVFYVLCALAVIVMKVDQVPAAFRLIFTSALPEWLGGSAAQPHQAFLGGTAGYALYWGMKRALFSNEAGQGSSPIAHSAAKTNEPAREGIVAGLEPFVDTLVVCTMTALVILLSGAWNREAPASHPASVAVGVMPTQTLNETPLGSNSWIMTTPPIPARSESAGAWAGEWAGGELVHAMVVVSRPGAGGALAASEERVYGMTRRDRDALVIDWEPIVSHGAPQGGDENIYFDFLVRSGEGAWSLRTPPLPPKSEEARKSEPAWEVGNQVFMLVRSTDVDTRTGREIRRVSGDVVSQDGVLTVNWGEVESTGRPALEAAGVWHEYPGASLTAHAFDRVIPGLGTWMVLIAVWLFAISTVISWSYYGEQGIVYLMGSRFVLPYKVIYCLLLIAATLPFVRTDAQLDNLSGLGTGVMLWANIPLRLMFGFVAMRAYLDYIRRRKKGELEGHAYPKITDVVEGKDVN